jgi:predicted acyl esterase
LHLRGNIQGYLKAGSKFKYLRAIVGRHDLPFYYKEEVEIQRSFLDAFLKGEDRIGWSVPGKVPAIDIVLRKGNPGFNSAEKEKAFPRRTESEWPIARTKYTNYYLTSDGGLTVQKPSTDGNISYEAPGYIHSKLYSN